MHEIVLFVEDAAHEQIVGSLVRRLAAESNIAVRLDWRNVRRGYGKVVDELRTFLRDLKRQGGSVPDLIIVATDANCKGLNERVRELSDADAPAPTVLAIADPHVERWLLLDGAAFKAVFGKGCDAPDQKCSRDRYKENLIQAIHATGVAPTLGGIEFAEDIIQKMDMDRAARADASFKRFIEGIRDVFKQWEATRAT